MTPPAQRQVPSPGVGSLRSVVVSTTKVAACAQVQAVMASSAVMRCFFMALVFLYEKWL